jgi:hypothetical protein
MIKLREMSLSLYEGCKITFENLMATSMKMAVFWDVAPCSLVDTDQCFRKAYHHYHQVDE